MEEPLHSFACCTPQGSSGIQQQDKCCPQPTHPKHMNEHYMAQTVARSKVNPLFLWCHKNESHLHTPTLPTVGHSCPVPLSYRERCSPGCFLGKKRHRYLHVSVWKLHYSLKQPGDRALGLENGPVNINKEVSVGTNRSECGHMYSRQISSQPVNTRVRNLVH